MDEDGLLGIRTKGRERKYKINNDQHFMLCWDHGIVYEYSDFHGAKPPECITKWLYRPRFAVRHTIAMVGKNSLCVTVIALFNDKFFMLLSSESGHWWANHLQQGYYGNFYCHCSEHARHNLLWVLGSHGLDTMPPCQNDPTAQSSNVINVDMWSNVSGVGQTLMLVSLSFFIQVTNTTVLFSEYQHIQQTLVCPFVIFTLANTQSISF